jgi:hypothetical protein
MFALSPDKNCDAAPALAHYKHTNAKKLIIMIAGVFFIYEFNVNGISNLC